MVKFCLRDLRNQAQPERFYCISLGSTTHFAKIAQGIEGLSVLHCLGGDAY